MALKNLAPLVWKRLRRIFLYLFVAQLIYIFLLKWINPPITITQLGSLVGGYGLKRDYVDWKEISPNARLAVIASEDQLFPDHIGLEKH
jgi:monofunctional glycosyltransferase